MEQFGGGGGKEFFRASLNVSQGPVSCFFFNFRDIFYIYIDNIYIYKNAPKTKENMIQVTVVCLVSAILSTM